MSKCLRCSLHWHFRNRRSLQTERINISSTVMEKRCIAVFKSSLCVSQSTWLDVLWHNLGEILSVLKFDLSLFDVVSPWIRHLNLLGHIRPFWRGYKSMRLFPCLSLIKCLNIIARSLSFFIVISNFLEHSFDILLSSVFCLQTSLGWNTSYSNCLRWLHDKLVVWVIVSGRDIRCWVKQIVLVRLFLADISWNTHGPEVRRFKINLRPLFWEHSSLTSRGGLEQGLVG